MDIGTIVIVLVVAGIGLFWLAFPFINRAGLQAERAFKQRDQEKLLVDYERVLTTIRELDDDFRLGKLAQETYQVEREAWVEQGTALVEQLEKLKVAAPSRPPKSKPPKESKPDADADLDAALEQAIAKYVKAKSGSGN
jgi:hypothetical protein